MKHIRKDIYFNSLSHQAQRLLDVAPDYNSDDRVRDIIRMLYYGCCAYCECIPESGSFYHIEHFYPKAHMQYTAYRKTIENLHYSCQRCNSLKGEDLAHAIFSPNFYLTPTGQWRISNKEKIENELFYIGHLLFSKNINSHSIDRGHSTIILFDLNNLNNSGRSSRQYLVENRIRVFDNVFKIIQSLYHLLKHYSSNNNYAIEILFRIAITATNNESPYSTMIIHNFGKDIYKLLKIYNKKHQK